MSSIRLRLTRKLLLALFVLFAGGLAIVYFAVRAALVTEFDDTLRAKAQAVSTVTVWKPDGTSVDFSDRFMRGFDDKIATDFFEMWQKDGKVIERSESLGHDDLPRRADPTSDAEFSNLRLPTGAPGRAVAFRFTPEAGDEYATATNGPPIDLVVATDRRALDKTLFVLLLVIAACGLVLLGATIALIPAILRSELRPLDQLGDQAVMIDARSLGNRFATDNMPAELRPITERLNDLLGRLQQSFERERRFSADLAHELRTPLAELCGLAEYALAWPDTRDPTTDQEVLAVGRHMEGLVGRMLTLVRSERGEMRVERQPIALHSLIESLWHHYAEKAARKKLAAALRLTPRTVDTDPVLMRAILANLFENAVEYTPSGGEISVGLESDEKTVCVVITNTVDSFDAADVPKLFDRFWRKEASRTGEEHAGLGLALARQFSHLLDWDLTANLRGGSRLSFRLEGRPTPAVEQ